MLRVEGADYLVEAIEGVYATPPALGEITTLAPLRAPGAGGDASVFPVLVVDPPPASATMVGTVPPTPAERRREPQALQDWDGLAAAILEDSQSPRGPA